MTGLLKFLGSHAQRLCNTGRPNAQGRVTQILADVTAARATVAKTLGTLAAADSADAAKFAAERDKWLKQQKEQMEKRFAQDQARANERRKLL